MTRDRVLIEMPLVFPLNEMAGIHFCTQRKPVEFSEFNRLFNLIADGYGQAVGTTMVSSVKWVWNILLKLEAAKSDNEQ